MNRIVASLLAVLMCVLLGTATAGARTSGVTISATINGHDVAAAKGSAPLRLQPGESDDVTVKLTNASSAPVEVRRVVLTGRVIGLTFFSYATTVNLTVAPGATDTVRYRLDLMGLEGQATGLIGGELAVTDAKGNVIAAIPTVTDVRGSLMSVYGLFGIALVVLTILALVDVALALAKHRLPQNRWKRGLRFLVPGIGIGLVLAFSASVARLWVPDLGLWLTVAGLTAAVSFGLGYFSPTPWDEDDDLDGEDLDDDDLDDDELGTTEAAVDEVGQ